MLSIQTRWRTRTLPRSVRRTATRRMEKDARADLSVFSRIKLQLMPIFAGHRAWLSYSIAGLVLVVIGARIDLPNCSIAGCGAAGGRSDWVQSTVLTMWQVQATSVALFITLFVFLIEVTRVRGAIVSVVELFGRSHLSIAFHFGIATILVTGAGRLITGGSDPTLADVVEVLALLASIAMLGPGFVFVIKMLDGGAIDDRQRDLVASLAQESVHEELVHRHANAIVSEATSGDQLGLARTGFNGLERQIPCFMSPRDGVVYDINLRRIARSRRPWESGSDQGHPVIRRAVGDRTTKGEALVLGVDGAARPAFEVRPTTRSADDQLKDLFQRITEAATQAASASSVTRYAQSMDLALHTSMSVASSWFRITGKFTHEEAFAVSRPFGFGPADDIMRDIARAVEAGSAADDHDVFIEAANISRRLWLDAARINGSALASRALDLPVTVARAFLDANLHQPTVDRRSDYLALVLSEQVNFPLGAVLEGEQDIVPVREAEAYMSRLQVTIANVVRLGIDAGERGNRLVFLAVTKWAAEFSLWEPEHGRPYEFEVEVARETYGSESSEYLSIRAQQQELNEEKRRAQRVKGDRGALLLALVGWVVHRALVHGANTSTHFQTVVTALDKAYGIGRSLDYALAWETSHGRGMEPWDHWFTREQFEASPGEAIMLDDEGPLLQAAAAVLVFKSLSGGAPTQEIRSLDLTEARWERLRQSVAEWTHEPVVRLGVLNVHLSAEQADAADGSLLDLIRVIDDAIAVFKRQIADRVASVPLDAERLAEFKRQVQEGWTESAVVDRLMQPDRRPEHSQIADSTHQIGTRLGRAFLLPEGTVPGVSYMLGGNRLGQRLRQSELRLLEERLAATTPTASSRGRFVDDIRAAIAKHRSDGYDPVILIPWGPGFYQELHAATEPATFWEEPRNGRLLGAIDGTPVFQCLSRQAWAAVVDLPRWLDIEVSSNCSVEFSEETAHDVNGEPLVLAVATASIHMAIADAEACTTLTAEDLDEYVIDPA